MRNERDPLSSSAWNFLIFRSIKRSINCVLKCLFTLTDSRGSFQLRTKEEVEKIKHEREEMEKKRNQTAWLGGSILDRHTRDQNSPNQVIKLPPNYSAEGLSSNSVMAPITFEVPLIQVNNNDMSRPPKHDHGKPVSSNSLLVPDRVASEYKDDDDENGKPSTLTDVLSISVPVVAVSRAATESVTILLSKKRTSLGELSS